MARTVKQKLADQEVKRLKAQEGMSDAVRAMFKSKDGDQRGTGGAADFFGRTFTRVSQFVDGGERVLIGSMLRNPGHIPSPFGSFWFQSLLSQYHVDQSMLYIVHVCMALQCHLLMDLY
jgi:hypothetical protein